MKAAAVLLIVLTCGFAASAQAPVGGAASPTLDFEFYRTKVEPMFFLKRPERARCYSCHSFGTPLVIQKLTPGATTYSEEQSRQNMQTLRRVVVPGNAMRSRLVLMPLAHDVGGTEFHPGGKHFMSLNDPELTVLVDWINGAKAQPAGAAR